MSHVGAPMPAVGEDLVRTVVEQVWEALLHAVPVPWTGSPDQVGPTTVTAEVSLTGDWVGCVRLQCGRATAHRLARSMLAGELDARLAAEDVHDALGELTNVVGGNIKGALPGSTALGLPRVAEHPPTGTDDPTTRWAVEWCGGPVLIEVAVSRAA